MTEIKDMDKIKKIELDILLHFDSFCKENGLRYFLAYGTLIGAIRHKGFIPWDDDIDVQMPREDYNKLIKIYNETNPNGRYRVVSPIDDNSPFPFVKFVDNNTVKVEKGVDYSKGEIGVDIDVFPLDGEPEDETEYDKWYAKLHKIYSWHFYCSSVINSSWKRKVLDFGLRILYGGRKRLVKKALRLHAKYPYEPSKYISVIEGHFFGIRKRFEKEWFSASINAEFEGHIFQIPCGYDDILRKTYGDYMKLPPIEHRVPHHDCKIYIKEDKIK